MNLPKFNQSIYPNKCLFYEDVKQFAKVYFVNAVAVRIRQSFSSPKFPVLRYLNCYYFLFMQLRLEAVKVLLHIGMFNNKYNYIIT